jgi:hypothetical protein
MRKLSVVVALVSGASFFAMLAPSAGAATTGSVSCPAAGQHFSGRMAIAGRPLNDKHASGPREVTIRVDNVACTSEGVTGTRRDWPINDADLQFKFAIAGTTCSGLNTAITLSNTGNIVEIAKLKTDRVLLGHHIRSTAATATALGDATNGASALTLAAKIRTNDFRNETATLTIDPSSLVAHCGAHQKNTVDFAGSFTIGS